MSEACKVHEGLLDFEGSAALCQPKGISCPHMALVNVADTMMSFGTFQVALMDNHGGESYLSMPILA